MEEERDPIKSLRASLEEVKEAMEKGKQLENVDEAWSRWDSWAKEINEQK